MQDKKEILKILASTAVREGYDIFLVGGYVRDLLLGKDSNDIDISVIGDATEFAAAAAKEFNTELTVVYKKFGTAMLELPLKKEGNLKIEFASARRESYRRSSRKPVVELSDLKEDLSRRDFTVNALAKPLTKIHDDKIIDLFGGLDDLKSKLLRTPLKPQKTFDDDPLRMMRAVRFASQLGFAIEEGTLAAIMQMKDRIRVHPNETVVSQERITDEFLKILMTEKPSIGLILMFKTGLLEIVFPEVHNLQGVDQRKDFHHKDVFYHTMQVLDNICKSTDNLWLRFAALMHDIAKPPTKKFIEGTGWTFHSHEDLGAKWQKKIFSRMRLPFDKLPYVQKLVKLHLRPIALADDEVTDSAIRRLIFDAGDDIDDLLTLCRADITSKDPDKVKRYLANFDRVERRVAEVEERDRIRNFQSPVRGEEIMKICCLAPSRDVGKIKHAIEEAILDGIIPNEYDAALEYLYRIKDSILKKR